MKRKVSICEGTGSTGTEACKEIKFTRTADHVDGNWAIHVYLVVPPSKSLQKFIICSQQDASNQLNVTASYLPASSYHISLSRTVYVRSHQIDSFLQVLAQELSIVHHPLVIQIPDHYNFLLNDTNTRLFHCLPLADESSALNKKRQAVDNAMEKFNLPIFYTELKFHISIGSVVYNNTMMEHLLSSSVFEPHESKDVDEGSSSDEEEAWSAPGVAPSVMVLVNCVECKIGNRLFRYALDDNECTKFEEIF